MTDTTEGFIQRIADAMSRMATTHIRLLNLCVTHKTDPEAIIALLTVNALAALNFDMLGFWVKVADLEKQRQAA